jgi:hypothetical protein
MSIPAAREQLNAYGWTMDDDGRMVRPDGVTIRSVVVVYHRGGRWQAIATADSARVLWSGPNLGNFIRDFYCATRIKQ